jgi:ATP-dependent RNA helicase RhlE
MTFESLQLIEPILRAVRQEGYTTPTPIQARAIPIVLAKRDILGCARTGTGKTAAFSIPVLQLLNAGTADENNRKKPIRAMILTPTRELAIQIGESIAAYGRHLPLRHTVIFGGVGEASQIDALGRGVDILVATPGRLLDLMNRRYVDLSQIRFFVLDEADRMLDMGFIHDVRKIISRLPQKRQTLFFSATMPPEIQKLSDGILTDPRKVEITPVASTAEKVSQEVYFVNKSNKPKLLKEILLDASVSRVPVFTPTKHGADRVAKDLVKQGIAAQAIHGNKSQNNRQKALSLFKSGKIRVLVATDIAARDIDVEKLSHVVNFELPNVPETYVHRIGRTGRAGNQGVAISFREPGEMNYLKDVQKLIGKTIPVVEKHAFQLDFSLTQQEKEKQRETGRGRVGHGQKPGKRSGAGKSRRIGKTSSSSSQGGNRKPLYSE